MSSAHKPLLAGSLLLLGGVALACGARRTALQPAAGTTQVPSSETATERQNGIRFMAQTVAWPGEAPIVQEVTPIRVSVENQGPRAIAVRLSRFALRSGENRYYAALPPFKVEGSVLDPERRYTVLKPEFEHYGFHAAPYYRQIIPGVESYEAYVLDPDYYDRYYTYWEEEQLPTPAMLALALPEGVVHPGGHLAGWLYFQKVEGPMVDLVAWFDDVKTGEVVASFRIPFSVE